jgi:hypothetical protein
MSFVLNNATQKSCAKGATYTYVIIMQMDVFCYDLLNDDARRMEPFGEIAARQGVWWPFKAAIAAPQKNANSVI